MEIKWNGENDFVIKGQRAHVAIDPKDKNTKSDVIITSTGAEFDEESDRVFDWPGEYEAKGVIIHLIPIGVGDDERRILSLEVDGIRICNLGTASDALEDEIIAQIGDIDVLMVPVTMKPKEAMHLIEEIDPRLVLFSMISDKTPIDPFLKEVGKVGLNPAEKLVIKSKATLDSENIEYTYLSL